MKNIVVFWPFGVTKFDDVVDAYPGKIICWLMILASAIITYMDWKNAKKIFLRDRYNHKSPNSTDRIRYGEALDVRLPGH